MSNETIRAIHARSDIVGVIGTYVRLKKQGRRYIGLCPFHSEKTPSFSVSSEKGLYYCFGCHVGGDVIDFLQRYRGLEFHAAVQELGRQVGVAVEPASPEKQKQQQRQRKLVHINEYAQAFFERALWRQHGSAARAYLRERGVPQAFAQARHLGYGGAPGELIEYLQAKNVPLEKAAEAGLLSDDGERGLFDERLIFPIYDTRQQLVGFGGRRLGDGRSAKYINTRETSVFAKRRLFYGWPDAEGTIRRTKRVVLVEGFMDVLAAHDAGLDDAVATLGTALSEAHAQQLARLADSCVLLLDGDAAGQRASQEAAQRLVAAKLKVYVAALPSGEDPDSFLRNRSADALHTLIGHAKPAVEHFLEVSFADPHMSIEDKAAAARALAPLIRAFGSGLERDLYFSKLAQCVGVSDAVLQRDLLRRAPETSSGSNGAARSGTMSAAKASEPSKPAAAKSADATQSSRTSGRASSDNPPEPGRRGPRPEELAMLRELLLFPELRQRFDWLAEFALTDEMSILLETLSEPGASLLEALEHCGVSQQWKRRLSTVQPLTSGQQQEVDAQALAERTFEDVLRRLKWRHVDAALKDVIRELGQAETVGGDTAELLRRKRELTRKKLELWRGQAQHSGSSQEPRQH